MSDVEKLAGMVLDIVERLSVVENTPRAPWSSIPADTSIDVVDPATGAPVLSIGEQFDGTLGVVPLDGPVPPVPSAPTVTAADGMLTVSWDGRMASEEDRVPLDFHVAEVWGRHTPFPDTPGTEPDTEPVPAPGDDPDDPTPAPAAPSLEEIDDLEDPFPGLVGAMHLASFGNESGGSVTLAVAPGTWTVVLVSKSVPGRRSAPSQVVYVDVPAGVSAEELAAEVGAARSLVENLRERVGREQWVPPAPVVLVQDGTDIIRAELLGDGLVRFTALMGGPHTEWWIGAERVGGATGKSYTHAFTATGGTWVRVRAAGVLHQATFTVTGEALRPADELGEWLDLTLPLDQIIQPGQALDPERLAQVWVPVIAAGILAVTEKIITPEIIVDGAVKARHLDVTTELADGSRLTIDPDGIRMWMPGNTGPYPNLVVTVGSGFRLYDNDGTTVAYLDAAEGLVLGNPVVGGSKVSSRGLEVRRPDLDLEENRPAIRLGDWDETHLEMYTPDGELGTAIDQYGGVHSKSISAAESFSYRGVELSAHLSESGGKLIAWGGARGSAFSVLAAAGERALLEIAADTAEEYRYWELLVSSLLVTAEGTGTVGYRIRYTVDGSTPGLDSPVLGFDYHQVSGGASNVTFDFPYRPLTPLAGQTYRVLITMYSTGPSLTVNPTNDNNLFARIVDFGAVKEQSTVVRHDFHLASNPSPPPAPTPAPVKKRYVNDTLGRAWHKVWEQGGGSPGAAQGSVIQGRTPYYPAAGIYRSMVGFPSLTGMLSGAAIESIQVQIRAEHWYANAGGRVDIGLHGATSAPGSFSELHHGVASARLAIGGDTWITIPRAYYAGFRDGTYRGITVHRNSADPVDYGKFTPSWFRIRATYVK